MLILYKNTIESIESEGMYHIEPDADRMKTSQLSTGRALIKLKGQVLSLPVKNFSRMPRQIVRGMNLGQMSEVTSNGTMKDKSQENEEYVYCLLERNEEEPIKAEEFQKQKKIAI